MADTLPNPEENSYQIFHSSPLTLQQLASLKIALHIWSRVSRKYIHIKGKFLRTALDYPQALAVSTQIPPTIRKMIESCFNPVIREMNSWKMNLRTYLTNTLYNRIHHHYDSVAFGGNGTVNLRNTIENFLQNDSLSNETKFELACVFCVEEKIDFFWPQVDYLEIRPDGIRFDRDFMMYYWISLKENQMSRIALRRYNHIADLMIDKCLRSYFYLSIEYFLSLLNLDDRLAAINRLCESEPGFKCIKYLLPRFEVPVQRHILSSEQTEILIEFIENYKQIEHAVQCWHHIKEFIKGDDYYRDVILYSIKFRNRTDCEDELFKYSQIELFLTEVWSSTPYSLKEHTMKFHLPDILYSLSLNRIHRLAAFSRDIGFVLQILSDVDFQWRNTYWISNWLKWIVGVPPYQFKELMKMCLVDSKAVADFVKTLTDSTIFQEYCDKLIYLGYFDELNEFFKDLYPDQDQILNLKKVLLVKSTTIFTKSLELMNKHVKYIDETFSNHILSADFKERLILSDDVFKHFSFRIDQGCFSDVQTIVSLYVSSKEPEGIIKTKFLKAIHGNLTRGMFYSFDESCFQNFLMWCLNDDQERFDGFMKSLQIDRIFEISIFNCLVIEPMYRRSSIRRGCRMEDLMRFLIWYFKSESVYENYIRQKIKFYSRMSNSDVENIFIRDKRSVINVLRIMSIDNVENFGDEVNNVRLWCARILRRWRRVVRDLVVGCVNS